MHSDTRARPRPARLSRAFCLGLALLATASAPAFPIEPDGIVVVVHAANGTERMSEREIRKLFLGKSRKLPDGSRAVLARHEPSSSAFNERALSRSNAQVAAAWSRLRFSGRVRAPHGFDSAEDLVRFVARTPNAVAYVPAGFVTAEVRPVFDVPR